MRQVSLICLVALCAFGVNAYGTESRIDKKIIGIALKDPDAFDLERVRSEGVEYVCNPPGYSKELDKLCRGVNSSVEAR